MTEQAEIDARGEIREILRGLAKELAAEVIKLAKI